MKKVIPRSVRPIWSAEKKSKQTAKVKWAKLTKHASCTSRW